jgi:hypothetical protein
MYPYLHEGISIALPCWFHLGLLYRLKLFNVQSMLGRKALETQLRRICLFEASETLHQHSDLDVKFQCCKLLDLVSLFNTLHLFSVLFDFSV